MTDQQAGEAMLEQTPTAAGVLVGRQRELDEARAAVDAARAGASGLLLVTGEAGIGKTRLVDELAASAACSGMAVLWGTCWDDPGTPPFWPWANVVRDCADAFGLDQGEDLAPLSGVSDEADEHPEQLRLRLYDSVAAFLRTASRRRPLLILVEDLHAADTPSVHLLRFLATNLRGQPVAIVATYRDPFLPPNAPLASALDELSRAGRSLPLFGLDEHAVGALMRATTGSHVSTRLATIVRDRTGGNPLFVTEVAKLLAARGRLDAEDIPIPATVRQVIAHRLAYVSSEVLEALACASVAGQVFTVAVLERITGRSAHRIADLLSDAADAGLVQPLSQLGRFTFTHALVRDALYAGMPSAVRRTRHRQVAEAIERLHGDDLDGHAGELADHYALALPDAEAGRALDYAARAGQRALATLAYEDAARQLARAVDLADAAGVDDARRVELQLRLGDARMRAGDWAGAVAAYEDVAAAARRRHRPDELARAALGLGAGLTGFEVRLFDERQVELLREALDQLGEDDSTLRAWVLARLSVAESFAVPDEVRVRRSREAVETARRVGDPRLLVYALSTYCDAVAGPDHTEQRLALSTEMVELGQQSGDIESELLGRRFRLVAQLEAGNIRGVDAETDAFARGAARLRWPLVEWYAPLWRGMRAVMEGRLGECKLREEEVRAIGRRAGSINADILADGLRLQRLLEEGRPDEVHMLLGRFLDDPEGGPNAQAWLALPMARMGRHAEARSVLDRLAATGFSLVVDGAWLEVISSVAEACALVAHRGAARRLMPLLEPYADRFATGGTGAFCFGSMARHLGLLAHCVGRLDDADAYFRAALHAHRRVGAVLFSAHTLRAHAAVLVDRDRSGDQSEAAAMLAEAVDIYRELGLDHWMPPASRPPPAAPSAADNVLRREGEVWAIRYGGQEARVRHVKGLGVLGRLLAEPGREFHVRDLVGPAADAVPLTGDAGEVLDARARQAYKHRLGELDAEIDEATGDADSARAARAKWERDALVEQLTKAYGLGGRARRGSDPVERARWTVTKQIHGAIERITKAHPQLGAHLANSVRTGRYCSYAPEHPTSWES